MTEQANTPFTAIRPAFGTLVVVLTLAMAACSGKESGPAGLTSPSPSNFAAMASAEAASPKPPLPVPVWTRTDLSTWPKAPPSDMGSFVVDVGNGEIWRPALASLSTSYPTDAWVRSWSPGGEALVAVNASYGTTAASAVYVGAPGGSLRHLLDTPGSVMSANWSPDGDVIALESWSHETGVNVRVVLALATLAVLPVTTESSEAKNLAPNGMVLAS